MPIEIERKFLVRDQSFKKESSEHYRIVQGFLNKNPHRTVRVRRLKDHGKLTIKGMSSEDGLSRFEWETMLGLQEADDLLKLCEPGIIDKIRYVIPQGELTIEVDEFFGENSGLILAEIELPSTDTVYNRPVWLGSEVTGDIRYYNSYLSENPFNKWV